MQKQRLSKFMTMGKFYPYTISEEDVLLDTEITYTVLYCKINTLRYAIRVENFCLAKF